MPVSSLAVVRRSSQGELQTSQRLDLIGARVLRKVFIVLSALALILLSGLRYDTGIDYMFSYVPSLEETRVGYTPHYDALFNFIIWIFAQFESNQWFFFAMAAYTVTMMYYAICKQSRFIALPVALYIVTFNYLRSFCFVAQYVSIVTFLVGTVFLLQGRYVKTFVLVALSCLLHLSGIVVIPLCLLLFLPNRAMAVVSVLLPFCAYIGQPAVRALAERFSMNTRFDYYITSRYDTAYADTRLTLINLAVFVTFVAIYLLGTNGVRQDKKANWYLLAQSFTLAFCFLQATLPVGYRFVWYFMIIQCVSIPYMLRFVLHGTAYYLAVGLVIVCFAVWMVVYQMHGSSEILPYTFVFDTSTVYW
ncbi:MAG: EpsG family protein [Bifidobacterium criceti]|nr:EpsG family protein [Bifidobacterium criceti]